MLRSGRVIEQIDYSYGRYMSITRHGLVCHWSTLLKQLRQSQIHPIQQRTQ
jgi:hypothetical protein